MKNIKLDDIKKVAKLGYAKKKSVDTSSLFPTSVETMRILERAAGCYNSMADIRKRRQRNRRYLRGDQWSDKVVVNGVAMTEEEYIQKQGKPALKQNLIRPPMRNVLGQYRSSPYKSMVYARNKDDQKASDMMTIALESAYDVNSGKERDARLLEEFLLSGTAIYETSYSLDHERMRPVPKFRQVNINRFFVDNNMEDMCGEDVAIIGELVDMPIEDVVGAYAKNQDEATKLKELYGNISSALLGERRAWDANEMDCIDFHASHTYGLCRVVKVCVLEARWMVITHDYVDATYEYHEHSELAAIKSENAKRAQMSIDNDVEIPPIQYQEKYVKQWVYYHLSSNGHVLFKKECPYDHKSHPYVFKLYPLIDGEVWSMVEDLIDQQKMINRMMILQDFIISASAKGVLLVPEDCISDDYPLEEIADSWTKYNGVIKIKASKTGAIPKQITSNAINVGTHDMINMQIKLMQDIGGVHGALQGQSASAGKSGTLYAQETQNAQLNIIDYLEAFSWILGKRDFKILQIIKQFYKDKEYISLAGKNYSKEAKLYDPEYIRDIEFSNIISKSNDTPSARMFMDDILMRLLEGQLIGIEMFLEQSSLPFSDKLLEAIKSEKEKMQQGGTPDLTQLQQAVPASSPEGIKSAQQLMNV